jgi:hypothetical protein
MELQCSSPLYVYTRGNEVAQLAETLCYQPESRGFDLKRGQLIVFNLSNPSSRTMTVVSIQALLDEYHDCSLGYSAISV